MCAAPDRLQQFAATAASTGGEAFGECSSLGRRSAHLKQSCSAFGGRERGARQRRSNFDEVAAPARGARATSKAAAIEKVMKVINTLTAGTIDLRYARSMEIRTGFTPGFFFVKNMSRCLTPVAGPTFETKNRKLFSGELFSGEECLEQQYCPRTLFPSMSVEWIHFPRIRTFVQKHFHGLFSKKKRSKSGVFLRFQKENTFGQ